MLETTVRRIDRHLRRRRFVHIDDGKGDGSEKDPESALAASAVSGPGSPRRAAVAAGAAAAVTAMNRARADADP